MRTQQKGPLARRPETNETNADTLHSQTVQDKQILAQIDRVDAQLARAQSLLLRLVQSWRTSR